MKFRILIMMTASILAKPVQAADVVTTVTDWMLNDFARAIAPVTGSQNYTWSMGINRCPRCVEKSSTQECLRVEFVSSCKTLPSLWSWNWSLKEARFSVTRSGVFLDAEIIADLGPQRYRTSVKTPVSVSYNDSAGRVELTPFPTFVPIKFKAQEVDVEVAKLNIAPYYMTSIPVSRSTFTAPNNRRLTAVLRDFEIRYHDGRVEVSNDVEIY